MSFSVIQQYLFKKPYGIHSPFLYKFSSECIFNNTPKPEFALLEDLRKELKSDSRKIEITDYGKGPRFGPSRRNNNTSPLKYTRKVSQIADSSLQKPKYCRLFFRMVEYFNPRTLVELGTSLGVTSCYFALADPELKVFTLEGSPQTADIAFSVFSKAGAVNVELIKGEFAQTLPLALQKCPDPDMIYIDGDHSFEGVLRNFTTISNHLHSSSVVIIDDIRWSKQMHSAWKQLVAFEKTTMALDLGKIGILFFNPALSRQLIRIGF